MKTLKFLPILLVLALVSCTSDDNHNPELPDAEPIVLKSKFDDKLRQNNDFAIDLFKATYKNQDEPNIFISPFSLDMALAMTWNGASGDTKTEMQTVLRNEGYTSDEIGEYAKSLREALINVDPSTKLSIANSIWYRTGFDVEQSFIDANKGNYNAEVKSLDFSSSGALKEINNWCARNTNDRIPEILDQISPDAVMYLINAIYFKGIWKYKFDKNDTKDLSFQKENGGVQNVKMMTQEKELAYAEDQNAQYLQLPYGNKAFSMIVVLPQEGKDIETVVQNMDNDSWNSAIKRMYETKVILQLPRFKLECEYNMEESILPYMGMRLPFSPALADFTGINKKGDIFISKVKQKTFVEVNEEGTEAAAVTSVEIDFASTEKLIRKFTVDKPFLFAIRENSTGIILFMGKIGEIPQ